MVPVLEIADSPDPADRSIPFFQDHTGRGAPYSACTGTGFPPVRPVGGGPAAPAREYRETRPVLLQGFLTECSVIIHTMTKLKCILVLQLLLFLRCHGMTLLVMLPRMASFDISRASQTHQSFGPVF